MLVPREIIQEIKSRLDIVDIIRDYIPNLKKAGKNWVGLCPFHNDRNPSLNVSPDIGIFKCFSCGTGGDVIGFIQKIENISFIESVKILSKKAGIDIKISTDDYSQEIRKKDEIIQFNNRVIKLFQYLLYETGEGKRALKYLYERGINDDLIKEFKLGYAPRDYNKLINIFNKKGFKEDFLIQTGIINKGDRGIKLLFYDRVIFPIINQNEECVGFGGRALLNNVMPKYINTPETILYKKSKNLYGINLAKEFIRKDKKVFLVEGYFDVISCYKNGLKNCVAPCGTAVTKDQINLLNRYADEIILFLDGDDAGKKGVEKALKEASNTLIKKSVLTLPDGVDPDEYFKNKSYDDFIQFSNDRKDGFDFLIEYKTNKIDKNDYKKLLDTINLLFDYIDTEENEVVRNSLIERLAGKLKLDKGMIAREFLTYRRKIKNNEFKILEEDTDVQKQILDDTFKREIDLLLFLLHINKPADLIKKSCLREEHFYYSLSQELFKLYFFQNLSINLKNFIDYIDDNDIKNYIENRLFSYEFKQPDEIIFNNSVDRISKIIEEYYKRIRDEINSKIKLRILYQDSEELKNLMEDKSTITDEILKLSKLQELKR